MKICSACKEELDESWFHRNSTDSGEERLRSECRICRNKRQKATRLSMKTEVINAYGGAKCSNCGSIDPNVLEIDHINGGGNEERRRIFGSNRAGYHFWIRLKQQGWPTGFRVLCKPCNGHHHHKKED